jgi:hypothetical protein
MRFLTNRPRPRDLTFDSLVHPALERRGMSTSTTVQSLPEGEGFKNSVSSRARSAASRPRHYS